MMKPKCQLTPASCMISHLVTTLFLSVVCGLVSNGHGEGAEKSGDPKDQFALGVAYLEGKGVKKDPEQAGFWFRKSADQGNPRAWNALGSLYCNGLGTSQDYAKARECFEKAAAMEEPKAFYNLGMMEEKGWGSGVDPVKALGFYERSEKAGYAKAALKLGEIYYYGDCGQTKDYQKAREHFLAASGMGDPASDNFLGSMAEYGQGGAVSGEQAMKFYRRGAEGGDRLAQANLGRIYLNGECGQNKDEFKAIEWLCFAEAAGNGNATTMMDEYSQFMDPGLMKSAKASAKKKLAEGARSPE